jgi:hypothetical protein
MTAKTFRRIALGMEGAVEGAHMKHPDFRANGKIFSSLTEDEKRATVKLTPEQQSNFVREGAGVFEPAAGAWGRSGWTTIILKDADEESVGEALTLARQNLVREARNDSSARKAKAARIGRNRK